MFTKDSSSSEPSKRAKIMILNSLRSAEDYVSKALGNERDMRDLELIWSAYSKIELAIGIGKFLIEESPEVGHFKEMISSITNDPLRMELGELKARLAECESDLAFAEYDLESTGFSKEGLAAARRSRDTLKAMLLGNRKSAQSRTKSKTALQSSRQ